MAANKNIYQQLAAIVSADQPFVLALIAGTKGSSPQRAGAKAIFFPDGKIIGTLGGGCLEAEVQSRALQALRTGHPAEFNLVLDHDFGWDDGLICGGSVSGLILPHATTAADLWHKLASVTETIRWGVKNDFSIVSAASTLQPFNASTPSDWLYEETVSPPVELWIAGSGHVAQALVPLAQQLDFAVTVFDDRPELANYQSFPPATKLHVGGWHELLKIQPPSTPAFGVVVTRGYQHDALVLSEWIRFPFAFLGMIGSRRKARIMREQFIKQKIATPEQFDRIACPVGLDISAIGTHEIAVSVIAQLIQKRAEKRDK
ncbi:MAG TPA: XdhC/CoxI family protein [Candidatus Cybelea sp.]|nr:XdhC/CoxI family protein [Candidatus Cybelea sp.]